LALFFSTTPNNIPPEVFALFDSYFKNPTLLYIFHKFQAVPTKEVIFIEYSVLMEKYKGESLASIRKWKRKDKDLMFDVAAKIEEQRKEEEDRRSSGVDKLIPESKKQDDEKAVKLDSNEAMDTFIKSLKGLPKNAL